MDSKIVVFVCLMGAAAASLVAPVPVVRADPLPQYSYGYDVQDALTGDYKGHQENRNGDLVTGSYSVVDPDGTKRTVDYAADSINGFNAVVRREPLVISAPARVLAPAPVFARAPFFAPGPVVGPAPLAAPAPVVGPAPLAVPSPVAPAPLFARAPLLAPTPTHLLAPRLPSPYYF